MWISVHCTGLPLGGTPLNGPLLVPRAVVLSMMRSPSGSRSPPLAFTSGESGATLVAEELHGVAPRRQAWVLEVVDEIRRVQLVDDVVVAAVLELLHEPADDSLVLVAHVCSFAGGGTRRDGERQCQNGQLARHRNLPM